MKYALPLLFVASLAHAAEPVKGLKIADGFTITEHAGPALANDIYTMHIDAKGRVVVAGRGYVRELITGKSGVAESARELVPAPKDGPMGLLWEGARLYIMSDGGLQLYEGVTGTKPTTQKPKLLLKLKTGGEHDAHAVRRGADGWLYVIAGNFAKVDQVKLAESSPVRKPIAGAILRMSPDGEKVECLADGFRNAYDFDLNLDGELFTYDSDNERCIGLPWYEHTRFYHVQRGGNYGWLAPQHGQFWRKPPYFPDVVAPVCTVGRGSPTAVTCYCHSHFPKKYQGGFFIADWTFGKIWFVPLAKDGATYTGKPEVFLESTGENGFAPTGMAVHPKTGELFISIGGRGTRGGVYRVAFHERSGQGELLPRVERKHATIPPLAKPVEPAAITNINQIREVQLLLGDLGSASAQGTFREGYSVRNGVAKNQAEALAQKISAAYPSGKADFDRELTRTLAALGHAGNAFSKIVAQLTAKSDPLNDVHHLLVLALLPGERTATDRTRIADAIVGLDAKYELQKLGRDRHWNLRMTEATTALLKLDPALGAALVKHDAFGQSAHGWLVNLPGIDGPEAARKLIANAKKDKNFAWTPGLIQRLKVLPHAEVRTLLYELTSQTGLLETVIPLLARERDEDARTWFHIGLKSGSANIVKVSAEALMKLTQASDTTATIESIRALRRFSDVKLDAPVRKAVNDLLNKNSEQKLEAKYELWETWLKQKHPGIANQLQGNDGYDAALWKKKLANVKWEHGDAEQGKAVFAKASCAACHNGGSSNGPSLEGITKRFNRDDLLTAILDPNREISPRYRTTSIYTLDGKNHEGIIIYDAPDGIILQVGADQTVRIAGETIDVKKPGKLSLMPVGLLDKLNEEEIAHLFAYLKTLGEKGKQ